MCIIQTIKAVSVLLLTNLKKLNMTGRRKHITKTSMCVYVYKAMYVHIYCTCILVNHVWSRADVLTHMNLGDSEVFKKFLVS